MALTGFKAYRRKDGDLQAQVLTDGFTIFNEKGAQEDYIVGDYLVNDSGTLRGAKKADFEALYEPVGKGGGVKKPLTEEQRAAKAAKMAATKAANKAAKEASA